MILKLDLHTHPIEAMRLMEPTIEGVGRIVEAVKAVGLDGIGVTEHWNRDHGFKVKEIVEEHFGGTILVLPGWEIDVYPLEVVELYLPHGGIFRFMAHPAELDGIPNIVDSLHGIEIDNGGHNWHISKPQVRAFAERHDLMLLHNSDAHYLEKIGIHYNVIDFDEMLRRSQGDRQSIARSS